MRLEISETELRTVVIQYRLSGLNLLPLTLSLKGSSINFWSHFQISGIPLLTTS